MIDYDSFSRCHLTDFFFAFHAGVKELIGNYDLIIYTKNANIFYVCKSSPGFYLSSKWHSPIEKWNF